MDMMTKAALARLDEPAYRGEPMPDGLSQPEQLYYQTVRLIYRQYRKGQLKAEQAEIEKRQAVAALDEGEFMQRISVNHVRIHNTLQKEIHRDGVPCKSGECRVFNAACGLMEVQK